MLTFHKTKGAVSENPKFMPKINGGFLRTPPKGHEIAMTSMIMRTRASKKFTQEDRQDGFRGDLKSTAPCLWIR